MFSINDIFIIYFLINFFFISKIAILLRREEFPFFKPKPKPKEPVAPATPETPEDKEKREKKEREEKRKKAEEERKRKQKQDEDFEKIYKPYIFAGATILAIVVVTWTIIKKIIS